jgi:hypothetical protein
MSRYGVPMFAMAESMVAEIAARIPGLAAVCLFVELSGIKVTLSKPCPSL